ncbi:MAG: hypothetical protein ACREO3_01855 [Arenimonas sp.]
MERVIRWMLGIVGLCVFALLDARHWLLRPGASRLTRCPDACPP